MALLDPNAIHPITLPDGTVYSDTVYLKNVIDHPRMEIGYFSYFTHSGRVEDTALILAPFLGHEVRERLVIGKFAQIARGSYLLPVRQIIPWMGLRPTRSHLQAGDIWLQGLACQRHDRRSRCLDRAERGHHAGSPHRFRRDHRCRLRGHTKRTALRSRRWQSGLHHSHAVSERSHQWIASNRMVGLAIGQD